MAIMNFGGVDENVVTREEFPLKRQEKSSKTKPSPLSDTAYKVPDKV